MRSLWLVFETRSFAGSSGSIGKSSAVAASACKREKHWSGSEPSEESRTRRVDQKRDCARAVGVCFSHCQRAIAQSAMTYQQQTALSCNQRLRQIGELDNEDRALEAEIVRLGKNFERHQTPAAAARDESVVGDQLCWRRSARLNCLKRASNWSLIPVWHQFGNRMKRPDKDISPSKAESGCGRWRSERFFQWSIEQTRR
jgi:hypothetical protein